MPMPRPDIPNANITGVNGKANKGLFFLHTIRIDEYANLFTLVALNAVCNDFM